MSCWFMRTILLLLLLGIFSTAYSLSNDCPPSMCGDLEINFPFNLEISSSICKAAGHDANLSCSPTNETILTLPFSEPFKVTSIYMRNFYSDDYPPTYINVQLPETSLSCPWLNMSHIANVTGSIFKFKLSTDFVLMNCTKQLDLQVVKSRQAVGPISCLSGAYHFVYAVNGRESMNWRPTYCNESYSGQLPTGPIQEFADKSMQGQSPTIMLSIEHEDNFCKFCAYADGENCGYNIESNESFCYFRDSAGSHRHFKGIIIGIVIGTTLMVFLISALVILYLFKKYSDEKEKRKNIEQFLATYKLTTVTRYSFSNIKKITKNFKHKLGQGGYGSVYKGNLSNGILVAVKMLEALKSNGEDFVNEVATIGIIHHINVVRLLGFCSDGNNRALVYEFMPNESLEKFIFSKDSKKQELFTIEKMQEIAIGIAQGIDYLHQGCNQRILHFDIKPHNILLDCDFNPKISDFGLAKLCSRDQSIVTISVARGTIGYIAPEVCSRNFGHVSNKSDVYSYGMLLLEMIGRRKNVDHTVENHDEIYFPQWIYNKLAHNTNNSLTIEMECNELIMRRLAIIAFWCIQSNPTKRPSMTEVVQMLTSMQSLEMPPTPFVHSCSQPNHLDSSTNLE